MGGEKSEIQESFENLKVTSVFRIWNKDEIFKMFRITHIIWMNVYYQKKVVDKRIGAKKVFLSPPRIVAVHNGQKVTKLSDILCDLCPCL